MTANYRLKGLISIYRFIFPKIKGINYYLVGEEDARVVIVGVRVNPGVADKVDRGMVGDVVEGDTDEEELSEKVVLDDKCSWHSELLLVFELNP